VTHRATAFTPPDAIVPSRSQSTRVLHIDTWSALYARARFGASTNFMLALVTVISGVQSVFRAF